MGTIFAAGEEMDFEATMPSVTTSTAYRRSSYSRCGVKPASNNTIHTSHVFPGGAVTDFWLSARCYVNTTTSANLIFLGAGKTGTLCGLWCGWGTNTSKLRLLKYDGTTKTTLADEAGTSLINETVHKIDMHVTDFSDTVNCNVKVYVDGGTSAVIDYTGNCTLTGMTEIDVVKISGYSDYDGNVESEIIVHTEDTRTFSLATLAPSAAGDMNDWDGAYTDIDETSLSDADVIYTNTVDEGCEFNLTNLTSGQFSVKGVIVAARASKTTSSTPTKIKLGIETGGTINFGSAESLTTAWDQFYRIMDTNPVTSLNWNRDELDALQIAFKAIT